MSTQPGFDESNPGVLDGRQEPELQEESTQSSPPSETESDDEGDEENED